MRIKIARESIISLQVDAIVNEVDINLEGGDEALLSSAGSSMLAEMGDLKKNLPDGQLATGCCLPTSSHAIQTCRAIFHTSVPKMVANRVPTRTQEFYLRNCYLNCLTLGEEKGMTKMAFPALGVGKFKFHRRVGVLIGLQSALLKLEMNPESTLEELIFVATDDSVEKILKEGLGGSVLEVSATEARELRLKLERANVKSSKTMNTLPVPNSDLMVASFVKRWLNGDMRERYDVMKLAHPREKLEREHADYKAQRAAQMREKRKSAEYRERERERRKESLRERRKDEEFRERERQKDRERARKRREDEGVREREKQRDRERARRRREDGEVREKDKQKDRERARRRREDGEVREKDKQKDRERARKRREDEGVRELERQRDRERARARRNDEEVRERAKLRNRERARERRKDVEYRKRESEQRKQKRLQENIGNLVRSLFPSGIDVNEIGLMDFNPEELLVSNEPEQIVVNVLVDQK